MKGLNRIFLFLLPLFLLPAEASGQTTCQRDGCVITITIHMVAVGGDRQTIDRWIQDIEQVWNGPLTNGDQSPTYGECKCPVVVSVNFAGWVTDCTSQAAQGYHCIQITPGPVRDTAGKTYRGYMRGVSQNGSSISGWWSSDQMNTLLVVGPGQGVQGPPAMYQAHDAAHEAGHMLGLDDDYNRDQNRYGRNIMGTTYGGDARPTPAQINAIVEKNCQGENAQCPDECCCGNGKIEGDKGEECDPKANPNGCGEHEVCLDCKCVYLGYCGDGQIGGGEECDPMARPTGCMEGEICTEGCICEPKEALAASISYPSSGAVIDSETTVTAEVVSSEGVEQVVFLVDGSASFTDDQAPFSWVFNPAFYMPGLHEIRVEAYDAAGGTASDFILITVDSYLTVLIVSPPDGAPIPVETEIVASVSSSHPVQEVFFGVDGIRQYVDASAPYTWTFNPLLYTPGPHEIMVEARNMPGDEAADAILVLVP